MEKTAQAAWNAPVKLRDGTLMTGVIIYVGVYVCVWVGEDGGGHALIYKLILMSYTITVGVSWFHYEMERIHAHAEIQYGAKIVCHLHL